jgi:hypothetical protein
MTHLTQITPAAATDDTPPGGSGARPGLRWTRARMAEFLRLLAATHSVSAAARAVEMSRQSAYRLRARLKGEPFDVAWQCALRRQYDALADAALDRAINGVEVPHFHKGELVHVSRRFDERLTVALLALRDRFTALPPPRYGEQELLPPDDFEALVERVAHGGEVWSEEDPDTDGAGEDWKIFPGGKV